MSNLTTEEVGIKTLIISIIAEAFDQRIKTLDDFYHLTWEIEQDRLKELTEEGLALAFTPRISEIEQDRLKELTEEQVKLKNSCLALLTKIK